MIKFIAFLLTLSFISPVLANDCQDTIVVNAIEKLIEYHRSRSYSKIKDQANIAIELLEDKGLETCEAYVYAKYYKAHGFELSNEFTVAVGIYHELLPIAKNNGHYKVVAESYLSLARIYETINRPIDCKRNLENAYSIIEEYLFEDIESRYAVRYASYQRIFSDKTLALVSAKKAIRLGIKHNIHRSITDGYLLAGMLSESIDSSVFFYNKAEQLFLEDKAYLNAGFAVVNQVGELISVGKYEEAKIMLKSLENYLSLNKEHNNIYFHLLNSYYEYNGDIALKENNIDSAYHYLVGLNKYRDSTQSEFDQEKINEMEIEFAIRQEKLKSTYLTNNIKSLVIGSVLLLGLLGILASYYLRLRSKNKQVELQSVEIAKSNKQLEISNQEKRILLSEVHHRVKNNLQVVISLLQMYSNKVEDKKLKDHFEMVSEKVMSISLIHEQLYNNDNFSVVNMNAYFQELKSRYEQLYDHRLFEIRLVCEDVFFNLDTILPIGIITTELMNNAIKHAKKHDEKLKITITLCEFDSVFSFVFKDNGPGYPDGIYSRTGKGIGSMLINSMVRQLLADSKTYNEEGAIFEMNFKEKITSKI